jgi:hypothetical protein
MKISTSVILMPVTATGDYLMDRHMQLINRLLENNTGKTDK